MAMQSCLSLLLGVLAALVSHSGGLAGEAASPFEQARQILTSKKPFNGKQAEAVMAALPVQDGTPRWAEATYLNAELCLKFNEGRYEALAKQAFQRLADKASSPWRGRGQIGLVRLRAVTVPELARAAKELDLLNAQFYREKGEAGIDGAFHLGRMQERLGDRDSARKSYRYALQLRQFLTAYQKQDTYAGLLSEGDLRAAAAAMETAPAVATKELAEPGETFRKAKAEQNARRFEKAKELYSAVIAGWPEHELASEAGYRSAECEYLAGRLHEALQAVRDFVTARPDGAWRGQGLILEADLDLEYLLNAKAAGATLDKYFEGRKAGYSGWDVVEGEAWFRRAAVGYVNGETNAAIESLKAALRFRPKAEELRLKKIPSPIELLIDALQNGKEITPREARQGGDDRARTALVLADLYFSCRELAKAQALFARLNPPPVLITGESLVKTLQGARRGEKSERGDALLDCYRMATSRKERGGRAKPNEATPLQRAYARLGEGKCRMQQFDFEGAWGCWGEFLSLYGDSPYAAEALSETADLALQMTPLETGHGLAEALYDYIEAAYPRTILAADAAASRAWILEESRPEEALRRWKEALRKYPSAAMKERYEEAMEELRERLSPGAKPRE